jgi:predicted TPR repeat methyltransferase
VFVRAFVRAGACAASARGKVGKVYMFATSSANPTADRRADYAEMLFADRNPAGAAEVMLGALELAPGWALGWFRLGEFHEAAGDAGPAVEAWRMALRLDPDDHSGAALKLALAGAQRQPDAPPSAFVETLFDQYADRFDGALVGTLGYRVPELLDAAIRQAAPGRRFAHAVDLGCGTGLMGERLRDLCDHLEGHDISAGMLRKARGKDIYDRLVKSDLQTLVLPASGADLVTAADVLMYVGALDRTLSMVAQGLERKGLFAFSVEVADEGGAATLRESRRYAHARTYVEQTLEGAGLAILSLARTTIRMDRGAPVEGLIVVARRD